MAEEIEYTNEPGERLFFLDLREYEQIYTADIEITTLGDFDRRLGYEDGLIFSANRGAHGGDLHVTWEHLAIRDAITKILREAGKE